MEEGEVCIDLNPPPVGLMRGYQNDDGSFVPLGRNAYRTGDVATRDADGYYTYVGRADDVFKASDYRISPFELESVLIEHAAVAEAAVVPAPDAMRLAVPKAYVTLTAGTPADRDTALSIFRHLRERLSPFKRVRRIEFSDLPKTISGKIRRVELRQAEEAHVGTRHPGRRRIPRGGFPGTVPDLTGRAARSRPGRRRLLAAAVTARRRCPRSGHRRPRREDGRRQ